MVRRGRGPQAEDDRPLAAPCPARAVARPRRAMSVVEVLVAVSILMVVMTAGLFLFGQSRRTFSSTQEKMSVLNQSRLLLEQLKRDLRGIHYDPSRPECSVELSRDAVAFSRFRDFRDGTASYENVRYIFDRANRSVSRTDSTIRREFGSGMVHFADFAVGTREIQVGGKRSTCFEIRFEAFDMGREGGARMVVEDVVVPLLLQGFESERWLD